MQLQIEQPYVEALVEEFPGLASLKDQLRLGNRVEVFFSQLSNAELAFLGNLYQQAGPAMQARAAQLFTLQKAMNDDGVRFKAEDLEMVLPAMVHYLLTNAIRGWLFTANVTSRALPYVITRLDYLPDSNDETGKVVIEFKANARGALHGFLIKTLPA